MKAEKIKKIIRVIKRKLTFPMWVFVSIVVLFSAFLIISLLDNDLYIRIINFFKLGETSWDWFAVFIAFVSLCYAIITYRSQSQTEKNTMKITEESQKEILIDYIRHFYFNLIIVCAIESKLDRRFNEYYPSEEHLLKLKVDLDDLHPAAFYNHSEKYHELHELLVMMRNYNTEIDVALLHLCNQMVFDKAKQRDFNTLKFKMSLLSEKTHKTIDKLWPNKANENLESIRDYIKTKAQNRNDFTPEKYIEQGQHKYYSNLNNYFVKTLFHSDPDLFLDTLNYNIHSELTTDNTENSSRILLIPFQK